MAYCDFCMEAEEEKYRSICKRFVELVTTHFPKFNNKVKVHLLLHLPSNISDFGPTATFNTERFVDEYGKT